jgi:spore maturation protein CgeB
LSDWWVGLDEFFQPGEEILIANSTPEAIAMIQKHPAELGEIGLRAQQRALACHTAEIRAQQLIDLIENSSGKNEAPAHRDDYAYEEA